MATLILPDGTISEVNPANGKVFTWEELHKHLECNIVKKFVVDRKHVFIWNEYAAEEDATLNEVATMRLNVIAGPLRQALLGNVIVCRSTEAGY